MVGPAPMETPAAARPPNPWPARLTGPWAAALVLGLFWLLLVAASWDKSTTVDEPATPIAGITHGRLGDYRLDPENGNLPHRLSSLLLPGTTLPDLDQRSWRNPEPTEFADAWLHLPGNDTVSILRRGRAAMALAAVALAALVWICSRSLFGPVGGMLSLLLCVLNPAILANGPLMTADTLAALFFLAATWTWWRLLQRITPGRLALSILATAGLLLAKMSGGLILPIALVLVAVRLASGRPLEAAGWGRRTELRTRWRRAAAILAAGVAQALAAWVLIWACYGFRYAMMAPGLPSTKGSAYLWEPMLGRPSLPEAIESLELPANARLRARAVIEQYSVPLEGWSELSEAARAELRRSVLTSAQDAALDALLAAPRSDLMTRAVVLLARHEVLPEAYLVGFLHTVQSTHMRWAFLNGEVYHVGRADFFPYALAVKTPLPFLGLLALGGAAAWAGRRRRPAAWSPEVFAGALPFVVLFLGYGLSAVTSGINIGHRHVLALYPPLLVLAGAAAGWLEAPRWGRLGTGVLLLLGVHAAETAGRFPDYLAYFNGIVSPREGYRHLVDSSLDWGQDLPGVKTYLDAHPADGPFYLSYFGAGNPATYGITADFLPSLPGRFRREAGPVVLAPVAAASPTDAELAALRTRYPSYNPVGTGADNQGQSRVILLRRPADWRLGAGTYLISATLLQLKPWGRFEETNYQELRQAVRPLVAPASFDELNAALGGRNFAESTRLMSAFEESRLARLAAFLRQYPPDADIGHSILVYRLTDADVAAALTGPPPYSRVVRGEPLHPAR
jgi:hypothetical protein